MDFHIAITPPSAVFGEWQGKTITLDNPNTERFIRIGFQNDGKTIHFSMIKAAEGTGILEHLLPANNYAISDEVSANRLFDDYSAGGTATTKELHHYKATEDYIRLNLAGGVGTLGYQFLAQFNQDGTYKAVAMGNPTVTIAADQTPCDTNLAGDYKYDMTDSAYTESSCQ